MTTKSEGGAYLSDDAESRMRALAPVQCRLCSHLIARRSLITERPEVRCGKPEGDDTNAEILGVLLMNLAMRDQCNFCSPFKGLF